MKPSDKLLVERVLASLNRVAVVFADEALNLHYINPYGFELFDLAVPDNYSSDHTIFSADTPVKLPDILIERISCEISQHQYDFIAEFSSDKQLLAGQQKILQFYIAPLPSLLGLSSFSDNLKKNKATQKPGYLFQVYDITESEATGKRLQQAKIAFESAAEGIMIMDEKTRIIAMNKGFTDITGYTEDEMMGEIPNVFHGEKYDAVFYQSLWHNLKYEGSWRGELWNTRKNGEQYSEWLTLTTVKDRQNNVVNYVGVFADISELKHSQNRLNELVNHDSLTGLPNRTLLNELLNHAIKRAEREQNQLAVLFIDLDRFKAINDSLGHQVGDKLLYEVSNRIKLAVRESDVVARLGGDEFLVMMDMIKHKQDVELVTKKIIKALQTEFVIDGRELFIGASVGIALYPEHSIEVDGLVNAADIAMYHVKNSGKNSHCFYSVDLSKSANELFMMENHLRRALERNQLEVYYQPQVRIKDGKIIGAESLLRWQHPELGMVSPAKFIPLAEETGLILQIGEWVLRESALQASRWAHAGYHLNRVSVNVSGVQIQRSNFADTVYGVLIETDCNPKLLELEITESTVMHNTEFVISVFNRIKNLGLKLAIDDFGTGYSSLSHLKRLPLDKLKIDQSFVRELPGNTDDAAIANAINAMASSLGFNVIAEGVETEAQAAFLLDMGCEIAQGYLYSRPVTAIQFTALLEAERVKNKTQ